MEVKSQRDYKYDNLKFLLIFFVVFGHLLELFDMTGFWYKFIYLFHMPVFVFVSGYFAKFKLKNIIHRYVLPYVVFQIIYLIFDYYVLAGSDELEIQFVRPYWILWYLLAMMAYQILIPLLPKSGIKNGTLLIGLSILLAIFVGYFDCIGYYLSLSRIFVFFPFFLLGYYAPTLKQIQDKVKRIKYYMLSFSFLVFISGVLFVNSNSISTKLLYGSYSYTKCGEGPVERMVVLLIGFCAIYILCYITPTGKIPVITYCGQNTMPVYLLHAFVIKLLKKYSFFKLFTKYNYGIAILLALLLVVILGNPLIGCIFKKCLGYRKERNASGVCKL